MVKVSKGCSLGGCDMKHLGCDACMYHNEKVLVCDKCGEEQDDLYEFEGDELCADCILKSLRKAEL